LHYNGGTSAATPVFAGVIVLLNEYLVTNRLLVQPGLGNLNPTLYQFVRNEPSVFNDITTGNNIVLCEPGTIECDGLYYYGYNAGAGYDQVTGLGSVNAFPFVLGWASATRIPTTTSLNSSATTVIQGTSVTLTIKVQPTVGSGIPTGTVAIYDDYNDVATLLATETLPQSDSVTYSNNSFSIGTHLLTAMYDSDPVYAASISQGVTLSVTSSRTYAISGTVALNGGGLPGVTMTMSGGASGSAITNSSGGYSFGGLAGGANYTIVPSLSGYTFSPPSQEFTGLNANQTANFSASLNNGTYAISGQISLNGGGLAGVSMLLSGGQTASTTTNSSGNYSFGGLAGGVNYLVVPSLTGYSFSPGGAGFDPLNSNQTANFAASLTPPSGPMLAFSPGIISTAAGNGTAGYAGDGGPATSAELNGPWGAAVDGEGNFYIADTVNSRVRVVNTQTAAIIVAGVSVQPGNSALLAGNGTPGYSGDGIPATQAELNQPTDVLVDSVGNLYIADSVNGRIREVSASGTISTIAGNGQAGSSGDGGPATSAEFYSPRGIALDTSGNLYIADFSANRVRAVNRQPSAITIAGVTIQPGDIATVAGNGTAGYLGDGGPASQAELNGPSKLVIDYLGNLYIADYYNNLIRKVTLPTGTIATAAGSGTPPYNNYFSGDGGPATEALLWFPGGVTADAAGDFYVVDTNNNRIRIVSAANGIITTLAGSGPVPNDYGYAGDGGPATSALLNFPMGAAVDSKGNIYIADDFNNRIRKVSVQQTSLTFPQTNVGQASAAQDVAVFNVGAQSLGIMQISSSPVFNLNGADTTCTS
jgi:sugar lactone lactonase YvrE